MSDPGQDWRSIMALNRAGARRERNTGRRRSPLLREERRGTRHQIKLRLITASIAASR
jgi:hypothetical protein